jgi:uncharacterized protein
MRRIWAALFLIVTSVVFAVAGCVGIPLALLSCMAFDAPGSTANPLAWLLFLTIGSFPFVCLGSIILGWTCYYGRRDRYACLVALLPLVNVLIISLMLYAGGALGKTTEFIGELFISRFGSPHQRLKWNAEKFFNDPTVIELCKAIEEKDLNEIDRLAKAGVNINAKGRGNMTPLLWAFPMGEKVFGKMLVLGADPNVQLAENVMPPGYHGLDRGKSVMSASVELAHSYFSERIARNAKMDNYLELVLKHGGNANLEEPDGNTPIFCASHPQRTKNLIRLLLNAGADINHRNQKGETPILAASWNADDFKLALLEAGADYRIADENGWDIVLRIERITMPQGRGGQIASDWELAQAKPIIDWLANEGVNWEAARTALEDKDLMQNLKNLPADFKNRPWLPQRPELKKAAINAGK